VHLVDGECVVHIKAEELDVAQLDASIAIHTAYQQSPAIATIPICISALERARELVQGHILEVLKLLVRWGIRQIAPDGALQSQPEVSVSVPVCAISAVSHSDLTCGPGEHHHLLSRPS
jgi:hypothetical protein